MDDFFQKYYIRNLELTKAQIRESVTDDSLIVQCVYTIGEAHKVVNSLGKRLREWYELTNPEASRSAPDHREFVRGVLSHGFCRQENSMGKELGSGDMQAIAALGQTVTAIYSLCDSQQKYLDKVLARHCPNLLFVAGANVAGKLIAHAGSLRRLAVMTASTIQLLGAEKALFRHMKTGARAPKHGIILEHPMLAGARRQDRGRVARALADKLSMAARIDFFRGEFAGERLRKELEERFGRNASGKN